MFKKLCFHFPPLPNTLLFTFSGNSSQSKRTIPLTSPSPQTVTKTCSSCSRPIHNDFTQVFAPRMPEASLSFIHKWNSRDPACTSQVGHFHGDRYLFVIDSSPYQWHISANFPSCVCPAQRQGEGCKRSSKTIWKHSNPKEVQTLIYFPPQTMQPFPPFFCLFIC